MEKDEMSYTLRYESQIPPLAVMRDSPARLHPMHSPNMEPPRPNQLRDYSD